MDRYKQEKINDAINLIEKEGGIVIIDEDAIEAECKAKEEAEHQQTLKEAKQDFSRMIDKPSTTYGHVEDMMLSHGLEMDYIEDFIHEMF